MKRINFDRRRILKDRHKRIFSNIKRGNNRIRVRITKTNSHIYVQAIDDMKQHTIASSNSLSLKLKNGNIGSCEKIAKDLSSKLKKLNVMDLVIDRGGCSYHGRIAVIANILREEGFNV